MREIEGYRQRQRPGLTLAVLALSAFGYTVIAGTIGAGAVPTEHGYELSFIVLAVALVGAGVAAALVPSRVRREVASPGAGSGEAHAFEEIEGEPSIVAPAEAGLAIGERLR